MHIAQIFKLHTFLEEHKECIIFDQNWVGLCTYWAIFSQTHPVTLCNSKSALECFFCFRLKIVHGTGMSFLQKV
jgi:hypothetical protein